MRGRLASATCACVMAVARLRSRGGANRGRSPPSLRSASSCRRSFRSARARPPSSWRNRMRSGLRMGWVSAGRNHPTSSCDRLISVKGDQEALAEDATSESALGWVPFVEGRARQLVFLRSGRARMLIDALSPGTRPEALTELLVARLLGRSLGHELGHVLLNSRSHEESGLMRARYRERDVLSVPTSAYTLNAVERARLFARMAGEPRLARE